MNEDRLCYSPAEVRFEEPVTSLVYIVRDKNGKLRATTDFVRAMAVAKELICDGLSPVTVEEAEKI